MFKSVHWGFGCVLVLSLLLLIASYLLEYGLGLEPCALCLLQRYVLWMIVFLAWLAFVHNPHQLGQRLYSFALLLCNSLGILLAARHLWLQYGPVPDVIVPCTADLQTMLQFAPLFSVLTDLLRNTHDCSQIHTLLGLPLSAWSMMGFIALVMAVLKANHLHTFKI